MQTITTGVCIVILKVYTMYVSVYQLYNLFVMKIRFTFADNFLKPKEYEDKFNRIEERSTR